MKRTIPEIRARIHEVADAITAAQPAYAAELHELAEETKREYHGRRAAPRARPVDRALAARVRFFVRRNPDMPQRDVGRRFGIDGGRVSEIMYGKRGV